MIRYRYNSQLDPPAPFVLMTVKNPANGLEVRDVPAQLDSAADRTVVTGRLVVELQLSQVGEILVGGLGGSIYSLPAHVVTFSIHDQPAQTVKVIASADEPWVLLGRDVLNAYRVVLDGPRSALELGS